MFSNLSYSKIFPSENDDRIDDMVRQSNEHIENLFGKRTANNSNSNYLNNNSRNEVNILTSKTVDNLEKAKKHENIGLSRPSRNNNSVSIVNKSKEVTQYQKKNPPNLSKYKEFVDMDGSAHAIQSDLFLADDIKSKLKANETFNEIQCNFKVLSVQVSEYRTQLLESQQNLLKALTSKKVVDEKTLDLEEENALLKKQLVDSFEEQQRLLSMANRVNTNPNGINVRQLSKLRKYRDLADIAGQINSSHNKELQRALHVFEDISDDPLILQDITQIYRKTESVNDFIIALYNRFKPFKSDIYNVKGIIYILLP